LQGVEAMMMLRNESGFSHQPFPRATRAVVLVSAAGVALIAVWVFAPFLFANPVQTSAAVAPPRARVTQPMTTPAMAAAPEPTAARAVEQPSPPAAPAPVFASASVPTTTLAARWSDDIAFVAKPRSPAAEEPVPLPRKRPSLVIAAHLAIPLPRPRPEIESELSGDELSALELGAQRQRE
jgi:hypothetical protein